MATIATIDAQFKEIKAEGNAAFKSGKYEKAISLYTKCIELKNDEPTVYVNRANTYNKKSAFFNVLDDCNKAIKLDPTYAKAYYWRASAFKELFRFNLAIEDYEKVVSLEPDNKSIEPAIKKIKELLAKDERLDLKLYPKPEEFRSTKPMQTFELNGQYSGIKQYSLIAK